MVFEENHIYHTLPITLQPWTVWACLTLRMEMSQTTLRMAHKLTTAAMMGTVLVETGTAPVNVVVGPGETQLVVSNINVCVYLS